MNPGGLFDPAVAPPMGYELQGLLGRQQDLSRGALTFANARVVSLRQGMGLVPLTDALFDEIGVESGTATPGFSRLSPALEHWARGLSRNSVVAYVEADYFGGAGAQSAVAWADGALVLGPLHAQGAINQVLRLLAVKSDLAGDEFDAVGLGLHRRTERWGSTEE